MPYEIYPSGALAPLRSQWIAYRFTGSLDVQFWANVYSMEITSDECLAKIRSLLSCRSSINVPRGFQGEAAQAFIDFLDQVSELHYGVLHVSTT